MSYGDSSRQIPLGASSGLGVSSAYSLFVTLSKYPLSIPILHIATGGQDYAYSSGICEMYPLTCRDCVIGWWFVRVATRKGGQMTRKDYRMLADVFKYQTCSYTHEPDSMNVLRNTAEAMCRALKTDNSNFRPDTFMEACGL